MARPGRSGQPPKRHRTDQATTPPWAGVWFAVQSGSRRSLRFAAPHRSRSCRVHDWWAEPRRSRSRRGDPVVGLGFRCRPMDDPVPGTWRSMFRRSAGGVVLLVRADVEDIPPDGSLRGFKRRDDRGRPVLDVNEWSPLIAPEDRDLALGDRLSCQQIDGQIEPWAGGQTVESGEPERHWAEDRIRERAQHDLGLDLRACVERHGVEDGFLVRTSSLARRPRSSRRKRTAWRLPRGRPPRSFGWRSG